MQARLRFGAKRVLLSGRAHLLARVGRSASVLELAPVNQQARLWCACAFKRSRVALERSAGSAILSAALRTSHLAGVVSALGKLSGQAYHLAGVDAALSGLS